MDALALRAEERRDKLRKAAVRSKYPMTRRYLNGETRLSKPQSPYTEYIGIRREPAELKHLSRRRKRKKHRFRVERGLDDLGIVFVTEYSKGQMMQELRNRSIIFNHITYQTSHVYICQNHPLAGSREIDMEDLIQYPFITYDRSSDTNPAF